MADSGAFWGTVVQVVPVLAIGVMIEFRYVMKRTSESDEEFRKSRRYRVYMSTVLVIVSVFLVTAFFLSVNGLRDGTPTDGLAAAVASSALYSAAGIAILAPGMVLAFVSTEDVWLALHRRMPWSKVARLTRELRSSTAENLELRRQGRNLRLTFLMKMSSIYVSASRVERAARTLPEPDRATALAASAELYEQADDARQVLARYDSMFPPRLKPGSHAPLTEAELAGVRRRLQEEAQRLSG